VDINISPEFIHLTTILVLAITGLVEAFNRRPPRR